MFVRLVVFNWKKNIADVSLLDIISFESEETEE